MPTVMIQQPMTPGELGELQKEFPAYQFLLQDPSASPTPEAWAEVEILYGDQLDSEQLSVAHRLRWIHVPSPDLGDLPLKSIEESSNLLISNSKERDVHQVAEFALGAILAISKGLFRWYEHQPDPKLLFNSPFRELIWSIEDRVMLQIGLGRMGTAILSKAQGFGMRTWGLSEHASFHPNCLKTYEESELNAILPACDVVCVAIPRGEKVEQHLSAHRLELMRPDSILIIIGSEGVVDEDALLHQVKEGKFRGVVIDATLPRKAGKLSPLYANREVIVTPEVSRLPSGERREEFELFRFNFRRFVHSDFDGMRNLVRIKL
jgi:phosphoglycerate dehydrogenase-like enzyme